MDHDEQLFLDFPMLDVVEYVDVESSAQSQNPCVAGMSRSFSVDQCIFCYGSYTAKLRKGQTLLNATAQGLQTIKASCSSKGDLALLTFINENQFSNNLKFHQACRTAFNKPVKVSRNVAPVEKQLHTPIKKRLRSECPSFNWKHNCFLCGVDINISDMGDRQSLRPHRRVLTSSPEDTIRQAIQQRLLSPDNNKSAWAREVKGRMESCNDLFAEEAVYHAGCYIRFVRLQSRGCGEISRGRPVNTAAQDAFDSLCDFLETTCDQNLYTIQQLHEQMAFLAGSADNIYSTTTMKLKLEDRYGSQMFTVGHPGKPGMFCFKGFAEQVVSDKWYFDRANEKLNKEEKVIKQAARLIACQVREMSYDTDHYPNPEDISLETENLVPPLLKMFIDQLIHDVRKAAGISQAIIQACRPRSCIMPILFGLGVEAHRKYGSAQLVTHLARLGFSVSVDEVTRYLQSVMVSNSGWHPEEVKGATFIQFVADNVDHNVRNLTGLNTFHGMGIISAACFGCDVMEMRREKIKRLQGRLLMKDSCIKQSVPIMQFYGSPGNGTGKVVFEPHSECEFKASSIVKYLNLLWHSASIQTVGNGRRPLWSGFMQSVCQGSHPRTAVVRMLPIIDLSPSDMTCVWSTLMFVAKQAEVLNVTTACITFDQPLYIKALDIVLAEEMKMVVRLGSFHTLMNFMGAVGSIMRGSGLENAFECIYGKCTVEHVMSGKAYSRAVRGHILVQSSLVSMLLRCLLPHDDSTCYGNNECETGIEADVSSAALNGDELAELQEMFAEVLSNKVCVQANAVIDNYECDKPVMDKQQLESSEVIKSLERKLNELMNNLCTQSRTAALWVQYIRHVDMLKAFIAAERSSDWGQHIDTCNVMLNVFAAAHHFNYAKSGRLYLQQMNKLPDFYADLYRHFVNGMFTIRLSDRMWAGLSTDLVIEQEMMKEIKGPGGLTRGRGVDETTRTAWLNTLVESTSISSAVRKVVGDVVSPTGPVEITQARMKQDKLDFDKLIKFFVLNSPFKYSGTNRLVSLCSGVTATEDDVVNCDKADAVGRDILMKWDNLSYSEISLSKRDTVKPLATLFKSCKLPAEVEIDANLLFHRLVVLAVHQQDVKSCFAHELTAHPASLFKDGFMRKPDKPNLFQNSLSGLTNAQLPNPVTFVVDGGCLLHRVRWGKGLTVANIMESYARYVLSHFGPTARVVFDGYSDAASTKDEEHRRRAGKATKLSPNMHFEHSTCVNEDQSSVLANIGNKQQILLLLSQYLQNSGFETYKADGDADTDIVRVALCLAVHDTVPVAIAADDTDILALLVYHRTVDMADMFLVSDKGNKKNPSQKTKCINVSELQKKLGHDACQQVLVLHALGGCDTTSAIFGHGKGKLMTKLNENKCMRPYIEALQDTNCTYEAVKAAGVKLMIAIYGGQQLEDLTTLRYQTYAKMVASQAGRFSADRLPPTQDAAELHVMRVHHQAVVWATLGRTVLDPIKWGWHVKDGHLRPIAMTQQPGPPHLMKMIRCNCAAGCKSSNCSCRRNGIMCFSACGHCHGTECENAERQQQLNDSQFDDDVVDEMDSSQLDVILESELDWMDEVIVDGDNTFTSDFLFDAGFAAQISLSPEENA